MTKAKKPKAEEPGPVELPEEAVVFLEDAPEGAEYTQPQVAAMLNIHRVTLLRMEQTGKIPKPKWRRHPNAHRVYTKEDVRVIKQVMDDLRAARVPKDVEFID